MPYILEKKYLEAIDPTQHWLNQSINQPINRLIKSFNSYILFYSKSLLYATNFILNR